MQQMGNSFPIVYLIKVSCLNCMNMYSSGMKNKITLKLHNHLNRRYSEEDIQAENTYVGSCSTLLVINELKLAIIMTDPFMCPCVAKTRKLDCENCQWAGDGAGRMLAQNAQSYEFSSQPRIMLVSIRNAITKEIRAEGSEIQGQSQTGI